MATQHVLRQAVSSLVVLAAAVYVVGCDNYTVAPVCTDDNAVVPPGIAGTYTFTLQNEDWSATTQEITIEAAADGRLKRTRADGASEESRLCQVNGHFVSESFNEDAKGYSQSRLYVTGMGITELPVFFDRPALDAAGIETLVVEMPETLARAAKRVARFALGEGRLAAWLGAARDGDGDDEPRLALIIRNEAVDGRALMRHSKAGPVGLTLLRK
jgi:hypothetical protein